MLTRLLILLPTLGVGVMAGLVAGLVFAGALQPPPGKAQRIAENFAPPRITNYSGPDEVLRHFGKPNSVERVGNTARLQWYGLQAGADGWQLDLFLSAGAGSQVPQR